MTVTYHSGRRIQGSSTDVAIINRGTITTDGSYTVIKFTENGKFTPTSSFNVEYLVVGGGGAGGAGANNSGAGAGGGAGGYRTATGHAVTAQDYNIIVGTGGTGRSTYGQGENGGDSTFDNITSIGGGGGGYLTAGGTGGSGGGSGNNGTAGASGTAGQGNSGGAGQYRSGGGGGGAGSAGSASSSQTGGNGGSGTASSITGSSVIYSAGGGGGGDNTGGTGGSSNTGGRGVPNGSTAAGNGVVNTGSGGGGTYVTSSHPSGSGADGVVILRFLTSGNTYDTSLGGKPTNVQVGSRFEETDTRKMYNFTDPLVVDNDFSSSTGWTLGQMSISSNKLSGTVASSGSMTYLDLTSVNISDDKWNMRFGLKITGTSTSSLNALFIGLADSASINSAVFGDGDHLGTIVYTSDVEPYNLRAVDGGSSVDFVRSSTTPVTNTQYYVEVIKDGANSSLRFYDSSDFTDSGSSLPLLQGSNAGSVNAFDYFMVKPYNTGSGSHTIEITNLKVYSGVTTTSNYWQEIGA